MQATRSFIIGRLGSSLGALALGSIPYWIWLLCGAHFGALFYIVQAIALLLALVVVINILCDN